MPETPHLYTENAKICLGLQAKWQLAHRMGNNDFETSAIEQIIADMNAGKISPQEANKKADAIIESKNDR